MRVAMLAALVASVLCCAPFAGDLHVAVDPLAWSAEERAALAEAAYAVGGFLVYEESPHNLKLIRVDGRGNDCVTLGHYHPWHRTVHVWPECFAFSTMRLQSVALHEFLHALGGDHICTREGELPDEHHPRERCSPVGYGTAVLNPYSNGLLALTALDLAEIRRHRGQDWTP